MGRSFKGRRFPHTRWSLICDASATDPARSRAALEELCETYWPPLYAYLRGTGSSPEQAEDIVQGFFARFLERHDLPRADPGRGRLRSYLLASLKHHLLSERERERAAKRGGNVRLVPLDTAEAERMLAGSAGENSPEKAFDRRWAATLLARAHRELRKSYEARGESDLFDALSPALGTVGGAEYEPVASRLGISSGAARTAVHRLRKRFRERLRAEVAETLADPTEIDAELRYLFAVLADAAGR